MCRTSSKDSGLSPRSTTGPQRTAARPPDEEPEADELRRLRRENANLKLENDILKKAAVILGTKPQSFAGR